MIPVIFLHGIGGGARSFAPQIASFASAGYQPVALDLPGYGTRAPVEAMSFDALAADVELTLAQSGLDKPVLVGHSMGGMVVQTHAAAETGRLRGRRALLHVAGVRQSGRRLPEEVRRRPARAARGGRHAWRTSRRTWPTT